MVTAEYVDALGAHWIATARTGRRRRGREWYPAAYTWAASIAADNGLTVSQVVAILAITSPGMQLATNLDHTAAIARGERDTGGRFPNRARPKIAAILASSELAGEYVTGPKVSPFHRAILGDVDALVLDRWAVFAAAGVRDDAALGRLTAVRARAAIDAAYRELARDVGYTVRDLQATLWLHVRETTRDARGRARRYFDITLPEGV